VSTVVPSMTSTLSRSALLLGAALLAAGCATQPGAASDPSSTSSPTSPSSSPSSGQDAPDLADAGGLVVQVAHVGGFVTPQSAATLLPLVSMYADGRVITEGPVAAIYPGPALPNLLVRQIDPAQVEEYAQRALDAGVGRDADYGMPAVADVPSTRITVVTADGTETTEVYALVDNLFPEGDDGGLTDRQAAARAPLRDLVDELVAAGTGGEQPYEPDAVAAVVGEYLEQEVQPESEDVAWPGPPLPGEPLDGGLGLTCVTARGEAADAVVDAAAGANATTPWTDTDGNRWSLVLRPLLPHESGCEDLPHR
jgi:hypothetical protein